MSIARSDPLMVWGFAAVAAASLAILAAPLAAYVLLLALFAFASVAAAPIARGDVMVEPRQREYRMGLRLQAVLQGARIASVGEGAARQMGLREGDVILAVNWQYVRAFPAERLQAFANGPQYRPISVLVARNNRDVIEFKYPR